MDGTARAVADLMEGQILASVELASPPERVFRALASEDIVISNNGGRWRRLFPVSCWRMLSMMTLCGQCPRQTVTIVHVTQGPPSAEAGRGGVALCREGGVRGRGEALWAYMGTRGGTERSTVPGLEYAQGRGRGGDRFVLSNREG